mmetsp:Transcript_14751/g.46298  ORF Transcript_14751/g.46298 Transcript_14751/m.46298 type:complete len:365 (-) Transcript_14751:49-1143(-)
MRRQVQRIGSTLKFSSTPLPPLSPSQVRIALAATGVCHRDILDRRGAFASFAADPCITGHEGVGLVSQVGSSVTPSVHPVKVGDAAMLLHWAACGECDQCARGLETVCDQRGASFVGLTTDGTYASFIDVAPSGILVLPDHITTAFSATEAAAIMCTYGTVWHGLRRAMPHLPSLYTHTFAGQHVVVTGASGGVGTAAVHLAKALGADKVTGVTSSEKKGSYLRSLGCDDVALLRDGKYKVRPSASLVVEAVGGPTFASSVRALAPGGSMVLVGNVDGVSGVGSLPLGAAVVKELSVVGADSVTQAELLECLEFMVANAVRPIVHATFPLEEATDAQHILETKGVEGRVVLDIDGANWPKRAKL